MICHRLPESGLASSNRSRKQRLTPLSGVGGGKRKAHKHFKEAGEGVWLVTSSIAAGIPFPIFGMFPSAYCLHVGGFSPEHMHVHFTRF